MCGPGMIWLFVTPNSGDCEGEYEDLLGITCPHVNGFTKIGCCPITPLTDPSTETPPTSNDPPNTDNSSPPLTSGSFKQFNMLFFFFFTLMLSGTILLTGFYPSPKSFWSCTQVNICQNYILYINCHILSDILCKATSNIQESRKSIKCLKR